MSDNVVIVGAARTAIGNFGGSLSSIAAIDLGAKVISELLERSGLKPEQVDEVILGQESMSQSPHVVPGSRNGQKMGDWKLKDTMIVDGLWDAFNQIHMGVTAENIAKKYDFSREAQDAFAAESQQKAEAALTSDRFRDEIVAMEIPQRRGDPVVFDKDEFPRAGTTAEKLGKLRPAFDREGTVTAGNASGLNDGAAAVVVMSERKAQ